MAAKVAGRGGGEEVMKGGGDGVMRAGSKDDAGLTFLSPFFSPLHFRTSSPPNPYFAAAND
jgi:hypothetical protein